LNAVKLMVPPLSIQRKFSERVAGVERSMQMMRSQAAQLDALFASLQHRAFWGEL
jgi:type I restriction enzyme S subunit